MPEQKRRRRAKADPWTLTRVGSYGTFSSAGSLPIEYLQTTFTHQEVNKLSLAREVRPDKLDFEMLMQRDIDESRATVELSRYLNPRGSDPLERELHSVFFPPLLIACVPCEKNEVHPYYPDETWKRDQDRLIRRWSDMFQLDFYTGNGAGCIELRSPDSDKTDSVENANVEAKFNLSTGIAAGVRLIAIDGQHRLHALRKLAESPSEVLSKLVVPVCILFATSATRASEKHLSKSRAVDLPDVPATFRKIFVDVNSKMERVGAHTNILLDDANIGSLIVREFCSLANEQPSFQLSAIEWNVRSTKDSTLLTREYSNTSIGIVERALSECFEKNDTLMRRLLHIEDAETASMLEEAAHEGDARDVKWTEFSIAQRRILAKSVRREVVPLLYSIFFELTPYKLSFEKYSNQLEEWKERADGNSEDSHDYKKAFDTLTTSFQTPKPNSPAFPIVRAFRRRHDEWRREKLCPVMGFALFQRSIVLTLRELMVALPGYSIHAIGDGLKLLLERAMDAKMGLYLSTRPYTLKTVWHESGSIVNREMTRRQLSRLTLAMCGGRKVAMDIAKAMQVEGTKLEKTVSRLVDLGEENAGEYWHKFVTDRRNHFARTFLTNLGLESGQIDELKQAKAEQDAETKQIQNGTIDEENAERPFDRAVDRHLKDDLIRAEEVLRKVLKFEKLIVEPDYLEDDLDEE